MNTIELLKIATGEASKYLELTDIKIEYSLDLIKDHKRIGITVFYELKGSEYSNFLVSISDQYGDYSLESLIQKVGLEAKSILDLAKAPNKPNLRHTELETNL